MTTATLPPATFTPAEPVALPKYSGLALPADFELSDDVEGDHEQYHADAFEFDEQASKLLDARHWLLADAPGKKLQTTLDEAATLEKRRQALEATLRELRWRRFVLVRELIPDARANVAKADAALDAVIKWQRDMFASMGITADSMPAGRANVAAAEHQLNYRIRQEEPVLCAIASQVRAVDALHGLQAQLGNVPMVDHCEIHWPAASSEFAAGVAKLAGIDPSVRTPPVVLNDKQRRIVRECGLEGAAILSDHLAVIDRIIATLPAETHFRPLANTPANKLEAVRALLTELPETRAIKTFLAATINGPVEHRI